MECTMYTTDDSAGWSCQINLRFDYDESGRPLSDTRLERFGPKIKDKADVELRLRQAQAAILNPYLPSDVFIEKSSEDLQYYKTEAAFGRGTLKFSRNTVVVDIYDPDSADLSFVDLPGDYYELSKSVQIAHQFHSHVITGLIQNEEDDTVRLVESLVTSNIQGNCLILVTIPMSGAFLTCFGTLRLIATSRRNGESTSKASCPRS